ncbi:MAG: hypothetical protein OEZ25_02615 [Candidatus Bathyarchaeota archaeon]|nr:hypothetical protein [Candidatus Bathyarchaeota archaeon]
MIDVEETKFVQYGKVWFYVSPETTMHKITRMVIIANGTCDLCIAKGKKPGANTVKEIAKVDKRDIVYVPLGDILWLNITPPYEGAHSLIMDIGPDKERMKELVEAMGRSVGAKFSDRGDLYDAHLGDKYWDAS